MRGKICLVAFTCLCITQTYATELVYEPINPSFGGNPLYSNHLLGIANAINDHKAPDDDLGIEEQSSLDRLAASLESRLINQLLGDVDSNNTGRLETDEFILDIADDGDGLIIRITDKLTGESSTIQVDGLVAD